jgi:hypothetical protein
MEKLGIPTVTIVTTEFSNLAKVYARASGLPNLCLVIVPHPLGGISRGEVEDKADKAFSEILTAATQWHSMSGQEPSPPTGVANRIRFSGTCSELNRWFFEHGWSSGLPVIPPTISAVEEMLKGTSHAPEEVVWQGVSPRMGLLTVEAAAICAVMAGCKPAYLPVILASMEAFSNPIVYWEHMQVSTGTQGPLVIVNGPIIRELARAGDAYSLAWGTGAAGPGHLGNVSIGYAIGLISYVIGGAVPGTVAMGTLSSPARTVASIIAENEENIPHGWQCLSVEKGFADTESVVSVKVTLPSIDVHDRYSVTASQHLNYWSHSINFPYARVMPRNVVIGLCPEHAELLARDGLTKEEIRQFLWERARYPYSAIAPSTSPMAKVPDWYVAKYGSVTGSSMIPITEKPEGIDIIVAGGPGKHSQFFYGGRDVVSVSIDRWR